MSISVCSRPIPGWQVVGSIKQAADADTYRVADDRGNRAFLKVFHPGRIPEHRIGTDGGLLEVTILESLRHPRIPSVIESGELDDSRRPYLLTELVPGETLDQRLQRELVLHAGAAKLLLESLLEAVAYLHELRDPVVHNELVPSNVVLDSRDERPFVIDFGHARCVSDGNPPHPSTIDPYYLPNECYEGGVSTPASDVFALGAICFRTLFGMAPWDLRKDSPVRDDIREAIRHARSKPLQVPARTMGGDVDHRTLAAIKRALDLRPEHRFPDASAFLAALTRQPATRRTHASGPATLVEDSPGPAHTYPPPPLPPGAPGHLGFGAVGGMEELKRTLAEEVIGPLRDPERYARLGLGIPNGLLLYGPPGCGKTFIAERFGEEIGHAFRKVTPSDVASIYIHGTQEKIAGVFGMARKEAPCVLFLDEVDAMIQSRDPTLDRAYAGEVNEWLVQMNESGASGVFVLAASNRPDRIAAAVRRSGRFDKVVYVGPPDHDARAAIFEVHLTGRPRSAAVDSDQLARLTEGRIGSDIKFLVDEAAREALRTDDDTIRMEHFRRAIERNGPSVGAKDLARYERMRRDLEGACEGESERQVGFRTGGSVP